MEIAGKVAVVTGGAAGIGRAIAKRLSDEGGSVVIADMDDQWGGEAAAELRDGGGRALYVKTDVAAENDVKKMIAAAETEFGGLDILVNNAFEGSGARFPDATVEEWSRVLDVALRGPMIGIQFALEPMTRQGGGSILNVASIAGLGTQPHSYPEYATAKAAIVRLTQTLAPLAEERGVRVNCIAPDWTATEFVRKRFAEMSREEREAATDGFGRPAPERFLEPSEVADAAVGLIRDDSLAGRTLVLWCGEPPRLLPDGRWE